MASSASFFECVQRTRRSHYVGFAVVVDTWELFSGRRCAATPRNVSRKRHAGDLGASALSSTQNNSAELRYLVGLFELRISFPCTPHSPEISPQHECSRSVFHLGDLQVEALGAQGQLGFVHLHGEPQQDIVLDFALHCLRWTRSASGPSTVP